MIDRKTLNKDEIEQLIEIKKLELELRKIELEIAKTRREITQIYIRKVDCE